MSPRNGHSIPITPAQLLRYLRRQGYAPIGGRGPHVRLTHPAGPAVVMTVAGGTVSTVVGRSVARACGFGSVRALTEAVRHNQPPPTRGEREEMA